MSSVPAGLCNGQTPGLHCLAGWRRQVGPLLQARQPCQPQAAGAAGNFSGGSSSSSGLPTLPKLRRGLRQQCRWWQRCVWE